MKKPSTTALAGGIAAGLLLAGAGGWLLLQGQSTAPAKAAPVIHLMEPGYILQQGASDTKWRQFMQCAKVAPLCNPYKGAKPRPAPRIVPRPAGDWRTT